MFKKAKREDHGNEASTIPLRLRDGTTIQIPAYQARDGSGLIPDFRSIPNCPECDGHPDPITHGARGGLIPIPTWSRLGYWEWRHRACSCPYGAWRYRQRIEWHDDSANRLEGLSRHDRDTLEIAMLALRNDPEGLSKAIDRIHDPKIRERSREAVQSRLLGEQHASNP